MDQRDRIRRFYRGQRRVVCFFLICGRGERRVYIVRVMRFSGIQWW